MARTKGDQADLLLHPVRLRILQALVESEMTTADLARALGDVPLPSLYRHIARLAEGKVIDVASERQVRGAVERTYRLSASDGSADGQYRDFAIFAGALLSGFRHFVDSAGSVANADLAGYQSMEVWMNRVELREFGRTLATALAEASENEPAEGRVKLLFTTVLFPSE